MYMVTVDATVNMRNRERCYALPLALLSFPSALYISFLCKTCSENGCSLDAWIWWDPLPGSLERQGNKDTACLAPSDLLWILRGKGPTTHQWAVLIGCCVGQAASCCCRELSPAFHWQEADHPSLSSCNGTSRLQSNSANTTILSLASPYLKC